MGTNKRKRIRTVKQILLLIVLAALIPLGVSQYYKWKRESGMIAVSFIKQDGSRSRWFKLEAAASKAARDRGLRYRKSLSPSGGMLFVYPSSAEHSFSMKDTYLKLDVFCLDQDLKVLEIKTGIPINSERPRKCAPGSRYIVMLSAGAAEREKIRAGSVLEHEGNLSSED